jgi:hypothetical protein
MAALAVACSKVALEVRTPGAQPRKDSAAVLAGLGSGNLDEQTIYVVQPALLPEFRTARASCGAIDGFLVCVGAERGARPRSTPLQQTRFRSCERFPITRSLRTRALRAGPYGGSGPMLTALGRGERCAPGADQHEKRAERGGTRHDGSKGERSESVDGPSLQQRQERREVRRVSPGLARAAGVA